MDRSVHVKSSEGLHSSQLLALQKDDVISEGPNPLTGPARNFFSYIFYLLSLFIVPHFNILLTLAKCYNGLLDQVVYRLIVFINIIHHHKCERYISFRNEIIIQIL